MNFYPRPPRGGRLSALWAMTSWHRYFYPRPPRGGRHKDETHFFIDAVISIHALSEEGDPAYQVANPNVGVFLSTPSARRATRSVETARILIRISIHALREEGDLPRVVSSLCLIVFLSTPSARRATA